MTRIILLDIDGVLVQPHGYRAALRATAQCFIGDFKIEEEVLTSLEKRGISSEWDMVPLIIASYWDLILSQHPIRNLPDDVSAAAREIQIQSGMIFSIPEFELVPGQYPAQTAYEAGLFSSIPEMLRKNLLTETRDIRKSETMRTFQHFTLGSKRFEETYQLSAEFEAKSLLMMKDESNINALVCEKLSRPENHLAAFTARPSHPPREIEDSIPGYAPEAELALELVGMKDMPLIAFGKLEYIASQCGLDPATLVKPSPFHALAGTLAAWTGGELSALQAAYEWHVTGSLNKLFSDLPRSFELIVVEDTMGGICSTQKAVDIFQQAGFGVNVKALGLTSGISAKKAAFDSAGVSHFENWDELIVELSRGYEKTPA